MCGSEITSPGRFSSLELKTERDFVRIQFPHPVATLPQCNLCLKWAWEGPETRKIPSHLWHTCIGVCQLLQSRRETQWLQWLDGHWSRDCLSAPRGKVCHSGRLCTPMRRHLHCTTLNLRQVWQDCSVQANVKARSGQWVLDSSKSGRRQTC